jgi:hypothetical protein
MKTKDIIKELPGLFQLAREHAADTMDTVADSDAAQESITELEAATMGRLKTYAKVEAMHRKEIANAIKEG